ncbi:hypothetical protein FISHEDRAFT_77997 [Fistulina hepatica ATCC 64428]|nr:hypothetical protein FISHEDRAFT_77997 [Fistulina hepatica ATCC 64428]
MSSESSPDASLQKEQFMATVRNERALVTAQELMNSASENCFAACISKPGSSLSGSEQTCLGRCFDRYMEAFTLVSNTYRRRIAREGISSTPRGYGLGEES